MEQYVIPGNCVVTLLPVFSPTLYLLSVLVISVFWESGRVKPHKSYLICPQLGWLVELLFLIPAVDWSHLLYLLFYLTELLMYNVRSGHLQTLSG